MKYLLVVNSHFSTKTRKFWDRNRFLIEEQLEVAELFIPKSNNLRAQLTLDAYDIIILVGGDRFFSAFVNAVFYDLSDHKAIAFIPDNGNSALGGALGLPPKVEQQLQLISKEQAILLDILKCHYIDKRGIPNSSFVLNDVLIGFPIARGPLFFKTFTELAKSSSILPSGKNLKTIQLINQGQVLYEGNYIFAAAVLGNRVVDGPKIPSRNKLRTNLLKFDYYQLNSFSLANLKLPFARLFHLENGNSGYLFNGQYKDLILKGEGQENSIIADGVYLGRLPATFTFLPKALKVIAPLLTIRVCQPRGKKLAHSSIPKPVGNRNSLGRNSENFD